MHRRLNCCRDVAQDGGNVWDSALEQMDREGLPVDHVRIRKHHPIVHNERQALHSHVIDHASTPAIPFGVQAEVSLRDARHASAGIGSGRSERSERHTGKESVQAVSGCCRYESEWANQGWW